MDYAVFITKSDNSTLLAEQNNSAKHNSY